MKRLALLALVAFAGACSDGQPTQTQGGTVTSSTAPTAPTAPSAPKMTFAECQASAEYEGGRYAVEYDNGICKVQRP